MLYVPLIEGYQEYTTPRPLTGTGLEPTDPKYDGTAWGPSWNVAARFGWGTAYAHTGAQTVAAVAAGGLGFASWQMQAPLMIALLLAGALATFGLAGPGARWTVALAGIIFAGPAVFQVFVDGSAGLLSLLALLPAMLAVGIAALRRPAWRTTVLFGVLLADCRRTILSSGLPSRLQSCSRSCCGSHWSGAAAHSGEPDCGRPRRTSSPCSRSACCSPRDRRSGCSTASSGRPPGPSPSRASRT